MSHDGGPESYPPPGPAADAKNRGLLKATGQRFYIGAFDPLDGAVLQVRTYQQTGCMTRHHGEFFAPRVVAAINRGKAGVFFVHRNGAVYPQWRLTEGDIAPGALERLAEQILVDGAPPRLFRLLGMGLDGCERYAPM